MDDRRIELISGLAAGAIGLAALAYALFGPTYSYERIELRSDGTTSTTSGSASLLQTQALQPITIVVFVVMALLVAGIAAGAYLHGRRGWRAGRMLLGVSTALLGFGVVITGFSIGSFLLPSMLLGLLATAMADRVHRREPAALSG